MCLQNTLRLFFLKSAQVQLDIVQICTTKNDRELKLFSIWSCLAGTVISRKMVVPIDTVVNKANEPKTWRQFGGSLELTEGWTWNILKGIDWVKRKGATGKVEPCPKFLEEEKFTFQRVISKFVSDLNIPLDLVLNLENIQLTRKIQKQFQSRTTTFTVTASGSILPIQLIYSDKTKRSIP